jgi:hypothetical protein
VGKPVMTDALARAAATDAGNRSMRAAGREKWDAGDYDAAVAEFNRLRPAGEGGKAPNGRHGPAGGRAVTTDERIEFAARMMRMAEEALGAVRPNLSVAGAPPDLLRAVDEAIDGLGRVATEVRQFQEWHGRE